MLKRFAPLAGLTLLLSLASVPAAHAAPRLGFSFHVGSRPSYAVAAPRVRPGYHWQRGYYVRAAFGRTRWVPGHWVRDAYRGYWRNGRYYRGYARR